MISYRRRFVSSLCIAAVLMLGCDDATAPGDDPPEVPPLNSLVIDFADFTSNPLNVAAVEAAPAAGLNWGRAALVVGVWNVALTVTLAVPVAAFVASFTQQPTGSDGAWVWSYNFMVLGVQHTARLEASPVAAGIRWEMYISKDGEFTDFLWFSGESNLQGTSGTWSLNLNPTDPTSFIDIEWNQTAGRETFDTRFTNVIPGAAENGAYIFHGVTEDPDYDAFFQIWGPVNDNLTEIEWNRATKAGRTRDPLHFGDSDWRCWDSALNDAACQ
jgi:hypothetical protein